MAKSVSDATESMVRNLEEKTGRSMADWVALVQKSGKEKHGEQVAYLKSEHGLTHGYANLVAHTAKQGAVPGASTDGDETLVDAQYSGPKADLRPIYDEIVARVRRFGTDVEVSPKKAYVSLRRSKQFAIVQPTTKTRVDVGINLKGVEPTERLEASGSFNAMVSHRVRVESTKEVDKELVAWLKRAYEAS